MIWNPKNLTLYKALEHMQGHLKPWSTVEIVPIGESGSLSIPPVVQVSKSINTGQLPFSVTTPQTPGFAKPGQHVS